MTRTVVCGEPPDVLTEWLERRRALGRDGHDEVWAGEYHVAPMADSRRPATSRASNSAPTSPAGSTRC